MLPVRTTSSVTAIAPHEFDLRSLPDAFYEDPFPTYRRLRTETPILELPGGGYLLTRHRDLVEVYKNSRTFSSDKCAQFAPAFGEGSPLYEHHTTSLVFNDPPLHTNVRRAIGNVLSNRMVEVMRGDVESLVEGILHSLEGQSSFDLIADFASAIPVEIIGNMLLIPKEERAPLRRWSLAILGSLEVGLDEAGLKHGNESVREFLAFLEEFVGRRRDSLNEGDDDILSRLIRWRADGFRLTETELYHQCIFLLNAGHETTTNLISNGIDLLLHYPEVRLQLNAEPELIDTAIEEFLRFESPNQLGNRTTTEDVVLGEVRVPAGTVLTLCIGAANRDPDVFSEPDTLDITRDPNPHLAFGSGIHTCAGLSVARLEARVAILQLIQRFPNLASDGAAVRSKRARFRGFETAPVRP